MKKGLTRKLLSELLKDSKRSDRELAKVLGVSQPTITRKRRRLVEEGMIQEFTVIPDFVKMGYEIMAISFFQKRKPLNNPEWTKNCPNMIFSADGDGMGKDTVMISLHKNYTEYSRFVTEQRVRWGENMKDYESMLISLEGSITKPLSLGCLAEEKSSED